MTVGGTYRPFAVRVSHSRRGFSKRVVFSLSCFFLAFPAFAQTYQDADFGSGWTTSTLVAAPPGATATATRLPTGGFGPTSPFRRVVHANYTSIFAAHVNQTATYDLSMGEIASIVYSYDLLGVDLPSTQAVSYRLLLLQNGSFYSGPNDQVSTNTWITIAPRTVRQGDFTKVSGSGPAQPNFSCAGGRITFGYLTANSVTSGQPAAASRTSGIDNWKVTITPGRACAMRTCCTCPLGTVTGIPARPFDNRCRKAICPLAVTPLLPDGTLIGDWGVVFGGTIWQWVAPSSVTTIEPVDTGLPN